GGRFFGVTFFAEWSRHHADDQDCPRGARDQAGGRQPAVLDLATATPGTHGRYPRPHAGGDGCCRNRRVGPVRQPQRQRPCDDLDTAGDRDGAHYLDLPRFWDFWATLEALDVPAYLHPRDPLESWAKIYDGHPWLTNSRWAFTPETATHALRLMA